MDTLNGIQSEHIELTLDEGKCIVNTGLRHNGEIFYVHVCPIGQGGVLAQVMFNGRPDYCEAPSFLRRSFDNSRQAIRFLRNI